MKWYLGENYMGLQKEIKELEDEVFHCWSRLTSPRNSFPSIRSKNCSDVIGDGVAVAVDMETELKEKVESLIDIRRKVEEIIENYSSEERRLLRMRYMRGFSWQQIAMRMYCDESTCRRMHRRLVRELNDLEEKS